MRCPRCSAERSPEDFRPGRKSCTSCLVRAQRYHRRGKFHLTNGEYAEKLAAQGGSCDSCGGPAGGRWGSFHTDHDRRCCPGEKSCGKCVRGLLCMSCNIKVGWYEALRGRDDIAAYVAKWETVAA